MYILFISKLDAQVIAYTINKIQNPNLTQNKYNYYHYQGSRGLVWISSTQGLNQYDGNQVLTYRSDRHDPATLLTDAASQGHFQEDRWGYLWLSNAECLVRYRPDRDEFERIFLPGPNGQLLEARYYFTYLDQTNNQLYAIASNNLFVIDISQDGYTIPSRPLESFDASVKDRMFTDPSSGQLHYLGFSSKSDSLTWRQYRNGQISTPPVTYHNPFGDEISDVALDTRGYCWLGGEEGLLRFDRSSNRWRRMPTFQGDTIKDIHQLGLMKDGRLLVGTRAGPIYIFDTEQEVYTGQILYQRDGIVRPFDRPFDRMNLDRQGNLWIGSSGQGVFSTHIDKPRIGLYGLEIGQSYGSVNAILEDQQQGIWVLQPTQVRHYSASDTLSYQLPVSGGDKEQTTYLEEDEQQNIWLGSLKNLFLRLSGTAQFQRVAVAVEGENLSGLGFNTQLQLPDGRWLFAPNQAKSFVSCSDLREYNNSNHLHTLEGRYLTAGTQGTRLASINPEGVLITYSNNDSLVIGPYANGDWTADTVLTDLPLITGIEYDEALELFWLSSYRGLFRLQEVDPGHWSLAREEAIEPNTTIQSMLRASNGQVWMSGQACLIRYLVGEPPTYFHRADGLQGTDFNLYAALQASDDRLFFGGTLGLNVFHPDSVAGKMPAARPQITRIIINEDPKIFANYNASGTHDPLATQRLVLPNRMNNLELRISSLEYSSPADCQFQYRLLGSSNEGWSRVSNEPKIAFRSLGFGRYTLEIMASNSDGEWSREIRSLAIRIRPPWYLQPLFLIGLGALLIGGLIYFMRRRAKRKLDEANLRTAMARLKMNPHVLFNGLSATRYLIKTGNNNAAQSYLTKFSKWMRNLMDNSNKALIRLDEEIHLLEDYINIEQSRVSQSNPFDYRIIVGPKVEPFDFFVPPLLFQPFVENAIIHGFKKTDRKGLLTLSFLEEKGWLICEIIDNGIGRIAAKQAEITQPEFQQEHNGIAIPTTRERIRMMNTSAGSRVARFQIIDLKDDKELPLGTKVRFEFKMVFLANQAAKHSL
ncbi:MAG: histidine kinase [Bacteroidota bacterium]